jgi:methanogenic corrinoid protein MtbC1
MVGDRTPTYNLKAVVQETGLKPDTLRAWERRYGIPEPDRSGGGHRLYSQYDINTLKWLLARQEEGLSISRAVGLWRSLSAEGHDPLRVHPLHPAPEPARSPVAAGGAIAEARRAWLDACLAFDERRAEAVLNQAFAFFAPEDVCFEVLQKGLAEIGYGWYEGWVTVQQEHFASALAVRRLDTLLAAAPPPTRAGRVLVGCPPGEHHTVGALLLSYLLRRRGWNVLYLGADVPTDRLQATVERTQPDLVVFSAQLLDTAASLLDVAHYLRDSDLPLAYGGAIFTVLPRLTRRIPGHYLGDELSQVPAVIEHLITHRPPVPVAEAAGALETTLTYFRERAGLIDAEVWQSLRAPVVGLGYGEAYGMAEAHRRLTDNILSALRLGDLTLIGSNLRWIEGMMVHHDLSPRALCDFLAIYHAAAVRHLDKPAGQPVISWLETVLAECEASLAEGGLPASP